MTSLPLYSFILWPLRHSYTPCTPFLLYECHCMATLHNSCSPLPPTSCRSVTLWSLCTTPAAPSLHPAGEPGAGPDGPLAGEEQAARCPWDHQVYGSIPQVLLPPATSYLQLRPAAPWYPCSGCVFKMAFIHKTSKLMKHINKMLVKFFKPITFLISLVQFEIFLCFHQTTNQTSQTIL